MSDSSRRTRQYLALTLLVLLYVGGIIGWSCAALRVEPPTSSTADTAATAEAAPNSRPGGASHESMPRNNGGA